jgi:hypothetical protein
LGFDHLYLEETRIISDLISLARNKITLTSKEAEKNRRAHGSHGHLSFWVLQKDGNVDLQVSESLRTMPVNDNK